MVELNLKPDEYVVMKSEGVRHARPNSTARGASGSYKDDLVLTNQSIILIPRGILGNAKKAQPFSLKSIKVINGKPQAIATGDKLDVYFIDRQETFAFLHKNEVRAWAHNVSNLLTGNSAPFRSAQNRAIPGAAYVAETLKDTFDTFKQTFRTNSKEPAKKSAAQDCTSCGASLSGVAKQVVRCPYCNKEQKLKPER